ncbi:uncharacterized protein LOC111399957 [Olea europaea var. sylvestris]|uniref:uncharacterized protein LOC111399957 n=1 Tax=Olea europaea var. sylvestris TaxID=158386 RepID=UPI000C1CD616|nr:uncharacterized protein LOC111399957 [Olea europaea var. sylvestris]
MTTSSHHLPADEKVDLAVELQVRTLFLKYLVQRIVDDYKRLEFQEKQSEELSDIQQPSPSSVNTNTLNNKCKLLDWTGKGEEVAEGRWSSNDPKILVHHVPLGPNAARVWVDVAMKPDAFLWRPTCDITYIEECVGTTVAWPIDKVVIE